MNGHKRLLYNTEHGQSRSRGPRSLLTSESLEPQETQYLRPQPNAVQRFFQSQMMSGFWGSLAFEGLFVTEKILK